LFTQNKKSYLSIDSFIRLAKNVEFGFLFVEIDSLNDHHFELISMLHLASSKTLFVRDGEGAQCYGNIGKIDFATVRDLIESHSNVAMVGAQISSINFRELCMLEEVS
ncbi:hypothetical protein PENTCL1PPCAC_12383, partial [Pristionchus entomophagus]